MWKVSFAWTFSEEMHTTHLMIDGSSVFLFTLLVSNVTCNV